ncbi:MAG: nickel-dependent lactate racemase, partial [bacterium]
MKIKLAYGKTGLEINVDENHLSAVYQKQKMIPLENSDNTLHEGLRSPAETQPLAALASGRKSACIVINDITRPVPNAFLLLPILEEIHQAGIKPDDIIILIATGTHRPNEGEEIIELVGPEIALNYRIVNHNWLDRENLRSIGRTRSGTEVWLNRLYLDADLKILTGLIEPHFMAGYSGGRKVLCPGLAGIDTMKRIHGTHFLESEYATNCILKDNLLHEELCEIADMAGVDFIVNVVLNEEREVCGVFCGDVNAAHLHGVRFSSQFDRVDAAEPADIVVTSSAGYPLDKTYYQAIKGLV